MKVIITTIGSRGDIHPLLAIGKRLRARGHEVLFATNEYYKNLVRDAELDFRSIGSAEGYKQTLDAFDPMSPVKSLTTLFEQLILPAVRPTYELVAENHTPGKTVVVGIAAAFGARIAREELGVPLASVHFAPFLFRSNIRPPRVPGLWMPDWMPHWFKDGMWHLNDFFLDRMLCPSLNGFRKELGLRPQKRVFGEWANSPDKVIGLFPSWFAQKEADWPAQTELTGLPLFHETSDLPAELEAFVKDGSPPIVFTPGTGFKRVKDFFEASVQAVLILGRRAIFLTPFHEQVPRELPPEIRHYDYVSLGPLLPHAAALVYHGGIGTCAQALAAATPQLVMPMAGDQFDNASRLEDLGVAAVLPRKQYRGPQVAEVLKNLLDSKDVQSRTNDAANRMIQSDPIEDTCQIIERMIGNSTDGPMQYRQQKENAERTKPSAGALVQTVNE